MSNLLTNSRLRVWRDCRRKHKLMYLDGWRPVHEGEALAFGSLVHAGLEAWWNAVQSGGWRLPAALDAMAGRGRDPFWQVAAEELMAGYEAHYGERASEYQVLAVERAFAAPLVNPDGAVSRTWLVAGKVDGIVQHGATGDVLLLEHKTTSETIEDPVDPYWTKLAMDGQVSHYFIGAESLGFPCSGCLYDVLRRPRLRPLQPTPPEKRQYKKDGTLYANQREFGESPEEYRLRVRADIVTDPRRYYQRRIVSRTEADIRDYLVDLWDEGRSMREAEIAGRAPRNPDSCHRFGTCAFWDVCALGLNPEEHPDMFTRADNVHPELEMEEIR